MREKGHIIGLLETLMVREFSCLHMHHFLYENFALLEFFEQVLVAGDEPRIFAFKNCTDLAIEDIEETLSFGRELVERSHFRGKKDRKTVLIILTFENGIDSKTVRRILSNHNFKKGSLYIPLIIDSSNKILHYNLLRTPIMMLEVIRFIKGSLFSKKQGKLLEPLHPEEEMRTIHKIESFRLNMFNSRAYVTWLLIAINIAIWLLMEMEGDSRQSITLINYGAKVGPLIWQGEFWRLITPVFLHIGFLHLLSNCVIIFILGSLLESVIGSWRLFLIYIFSGIVGNLLSLRFSPYLSAGASSGVFGILGALITYGILYKKLIPRNFHKVIVLYLTPFLIYNLAIGFLYSHTDNFAHIGGMFGGIFLSYILSVEFPHPSSRKPKWAVVIALALAFALLYMFCMQAYPESYKIYYYVKAEVRTLESRPVEALACLRQCLEIDPRYSRARILYGKISYSLGHTRFIEDRFAAALPFFKSSLESFPISARYNKAISNVCENIGDCLAGMGKDMETLKYYRHASLLSPRDKRLRKKLSNQYRITATTLFEEYDFDKSIKYALKAIKQDKENSQARKLLGAAYYRKGQIYKAAGIWKEALNLYPKNSSFRRILSENIFRTFWYRSNVKYRPSVGDPRARRLNEEGEDILIATGDFENAGEKFRKSHRIDPDYAPPLNNLARIELMLNNDEDARKWIEKSLKVDPQYWEALVSKANLNMKQNKPDKAREILDECIRIKPEYADCYGILGTLFRQRKQFDEAEKYLSKALSLEPKNVPFRMEMARTYYEMDEIRKFEIESNSGIGYAEAQDRENLSILIRMFLRKNGELKD